jgi:AbrB family looped-hinge helix DNA binding protein
MSVATLTSKDQITLPQAVRSSLGLQAGDKLDFVADGARRAAAPRVRRPAQRRSDLAVGMIGLDTHVLVRYLTQDAPRSPHAPPA